MARKDETSAIAFLAVALSIAAVIVSMWCLKLHMTTQANSWRISDVEIEQSSIKAKVDELWLEGVKLEQPK